jgi:ribosomal protein S18 acetylase RimI-like enzyme
VIERLSSFLPISPIGLAALYRDHDRPDEGELIQVWVSPEGRGGNVAIDLMNAIFAWAVSNGFETVRAEVTRNNSRALRFYEKCGFVMTDPDQPSGEPTCILTKEIGQG